MRRLDPRLGGVTTSVYDSLRRLTKREFGGSGQTPLRVDFTDTARGQLDTITSYSDLAGATKVGSTTFTYDAGQRITRLEHRNGSGSLLANYTYTYDAASRLFTQTERLSPMSALVHRSDCSDS